MPTEIIVAIIGGVAVVSAAIIGLVATKTKKNNADIGKTDSHNQTANGNNNTQIQINK